MTSSCCETVVVSDDDTVLVSTVVGVLTTVVENDVLIVVDSSIDVAVITQSEVVIVDESVGPQGPPGPPGTSGLLTLVAAENISQYSVVRILSDGLAYLADRNDPTHGVFVAGIAKTSALTGESFDAITDGLLDTPAVWAVGPLYVGDNGALISTPPPGTFTDYQLQVAVAVTTARLLVRPQFPIFNP